MIFFGFQKCHGKPNFGFHFLKSVRFGFSKTDSEPTFGFPHIPNFFAELHIKKIPKCILICPFRPQRSERIGLENKKIKLSTRNALKKRQRYFLHLNFSSLILILIITREIAVGLIIMR